MLLYNTLQALILKMIVIYPIYFSDVWNISGLQLKWLLFPSKLTNARFSRVAPTEYKELKIKI
jgi:hypothetical protein